MTEPVWTKQNLDAPHAVADKAQRVQAMFSAIAPSYDINNRVHSLWRDQAWRRAAVGQAQVQAGDTILDVACGTGDLTLAFAATAKAKGQPSNEKTGPKRVLGIDFTFDMLTIAKDKAAARYPAEKQNSQRRPTFMVGDAMALPVADQSVDVVSIAFGIRNVAKPSVAIAEFFRVMRPGGRLIVLEFSLPRNALMRGLYNFYFKHILPRTAALIARDRSGAYRYLPKSVNTFIEREQMVEMLEEAGFGQVTVKALTMGVAVIYRGVKQ
jgi:demethylmenaquinone methyltransferase/2-methoxy-6-polyprenyl-1,4-benzoquinol methylase